MLGRSSRIERIRQSAASVSELALQLAQDKKFRERLASAIAHTANAALHTRRRLGLPVRLARLATDQTLLRELRRARSDLEHAYARVEQKRRSHKLRNLFLLALLGSLAALPRLRARLVAAIARATGHGQRASGPQEQSVTSDDFAGRTPKLEEMTREQLYALAQEAGISGRSEMSKEQLVEALRARG